MTSNIMSRLEYFSHASLVEMREVALYRCPEYTGLVADRSHLINTPEIGEILDLTRLS